MTIGLHLATLYTILLLPLNFSARNAAITPESGSLRTAYGRKRFRYWLMYLRTLSTILIWVVLPWFTLHRPDHVLTIGHLNFKVYRSWETPKMCAYQATELVFLKPAPGTASIYMFVHSLLNLFLSLSICYELNTPSILALNSFHTACPSYLTHLSASLIQSIPYKHAAMSASIKWVIQSQALSWELQ